MPQGYETLLFNYLADTYLAMYFDVLRDALPSSLGSVTMLSNGEGKPKISLKPTNVEGSSPEKIKRNLCMWYRCN